MRDRLKALINDVVHPCHTGALADYLIENGVIVPPCKVGDTVYTILRGKIFCYTVLEYSIRGECNSVYAENDRDFLDFPFAELGKTVFLTREEAEQALLKL